MEEFAYPNYPASHDAPPNRFSDLPFEHSHLAAVTPTTYAASRPSTADASQHSTWPYYLDSPTPAYTANQLPYNYAEAPYDFGEYPDIPHASEDPRTFQQPAIYLPQASYYPTKPWYYLESSNSPTTEYTLSPVDGHSNGGYFSSISDFEDAPPDPFAYLTPPPLNNSTYSELSHALDEPLPPPIPPAVEVPRFEPEPALVHPADLDEPPMAFLRPDSPGGVSPDGRSSMSIEPVGSPPIESVPTPQSPEQLPAAGSSIAMNVQVEPVPLRASESHRMTKRKRVTPRLKTPEPVAAPSSPLTPTAAATSPGPTHATIPQEPTAGVGSSKPKKKKRARAAVPDDEDEDAENSKRRKKPSLACLFCRERKIACSLPEEGAEDKRCNQCVKRSRECEMPAESRRGHYQRKLKDKSQQPNASAVMFVEEEPLTA